MTLVIDMNRKQVLKQVKKNKKNSQPVTEENYVNSFIFTILILIVLVIVGYLIIGIFVTKTINFGKDKEENKEEVTIDNKTILAGQIFDQKESDYYVLIYDVSDTKNFLGNWKSVYSGKEGALPVYVVDSESKLNAKFISDKESNKEATGYEDLKIKSPSLIKISNKIISGYTEGEEEIKKIFKE